MTRDPPSLDFSILPSRGTSVTLTFDVPPITICPTFVCIKGSRKASQTTLALSEPHQLYLPTAQPTACQCLELLRRIPRLTDTRWRSTPCSHHQRLRRRRRPRILSVSSHCVNKVVICLLLFSPFFASRLIDGGTWCIDRGIQPVGGENFSSTEITPAHSGTTSTPTHIEGSTRVKSHIPLSPFYTYATRSTLSFSSTSSQGTTQGDGSNGQPPGGEIGGGRQEARHMDQGRVPTSTHTHY